MFDSLLFTGLFTVFFILPLLLLLLLLFEGLGFVEDEGWFEEEVFKSIEVLLLLLLLFVESTGFSLSFILGTRNGS